MNTQPTPHQEGTMSDLRIVAHKSKETPSGYLYWFEVQGPIDSCGHRHESRIEAGNCKRQTLTEMSKHADDCPCFECDTEPTR
jgi:hypothetical protein